MRPNLVLVLLVGVLFATGVTLLLERSLSRVVLGFILVGNGANLLLLLAGRSGGAPVIGVTPTAGMSDPLTQAMVLTALVITLGMTAFLLALAYRSWQLTGHDEVQDDLEDRRIVRLAEQDRDSGPDDSITEAARDPWVGGAGRVDPEQVDPEPPPRRVGDDPQPGRQPDDGAPPPGRRPDGVGDG